ncbi:MAG: OadG family protein [bacterium]
MSNISLGEVVIAIVGYLIVFIALVSLYTLFRMLPRIINYNFKRERKTRGREVKEGEEKNIISGEETAAIAMALHLILDEMHDEESGVLTIKKVSKAYSPWSSKIYAVRNQFNRI